MKVGPLAFPVANARELIGFALLVIVTLYVAKSIKSSAPSSVQKLLP